MKKYSYPRFVDKKNIEKIEDIKNHRLFKLSIPLNLDGDKSALIITRSPRIYNEDGSSHIISKALKYIKTKIHEEFYGISKVEFVFLFPVSEYNEEYLYTILDESGEKHFIGNDGFYDNGGSLIKNDDLIFYAMMEADYIVFAWGDMPPEINYVGSERVKYILKGYKMIKNNSDNIKETYNIGYTESGTPKHCLMWRETDSIYRFEV